MILVLLIRTPIITITIMIIVMCINECIIYIYIYIERERERERDILGQVDEYEKTIENLGKEMERTRAQNSVDN